MIEPVLLLIVMVIMKLLLIYGYSIQINGLEQVIVKEFKFLALDSLIKDEF